MKPNLKCITLCLIFLGGIAITRGFVISISNSGYENIYVSIHRDVNESKALVEGIKDVFTKGSAFLFNATGQRLFYKTVTIVLPSTWSQNLTNENVFGEYYEEAHIRVASPNPEFGDAPYTLQPGGCGDPGLYIHLTPKFILERNDWTYEMFGDTGRQLVHEWAHFRYGVFDEYGTPGNSRFPMFYQDGGKIHPTSCIKEVKGWIERENGDPCIVYAGGRVGDDCMFVPNLDMDEATASIMYMPFIPTMEGFCNKTGKNKAHNWRAPSKQNAFCDYKSTWEVISKHADFNLNKILPTNTKTTPNFRIVRVAPADQRRTVLLIDASGSMNSNKRMELLRSSAHRLIIDLFPTNTSLGIVQFAETARVMAPMTKITEKNIRQQLANVIPKRGNGGTAIGLGLQEALKVFRKGNQSTEGNMIILISDGDETVKPLIETVYPEVIKSGVIINAIAIGPNATPWIEKLTSSTGGKGFYFPDGQAVATTLDSAFSNSMTSQADVELQAITMRDNREKVKKNIPSKQDFQIEKELGTNTQLLITGTNIRDVEITVTSPSKKVYNKNSSKEYDEDLTIKNRKLFTFAEAETGQWTANFASTVDTDIFVKITSEPKNPKDQPIRAKAWFGDIELTYPAFAKVYAQVSKGYHAVINATVKAFIERPNDKPFEILLQDNGAGADALKNDGIYTSYFSQFTGQGRYSAVAIVSNDGNAMVKRGIPGSGAPQKPKNTTNAANKGKEPVSDFPLSEFKHSASSPPEPPVESDPAQIFNRNADAGAFRMTGNPSTVVGDKIPPIRVTDLNAFLENDDKTVRLTWTAPGDDLDVGTPKKIDIRWNLRPETLIFDFESVVDDAITLDKDLDKAGSISEMFLNETNYKDLINNQNSTDIYFALRAADKAGNLSPVSNVASVHIGYHVAPKEIKDDDDSSGKIDGKLVGIVIGVIAVVGIIVAVVATVILKKRKNKPKQFA